MKRTRIVMVLAASLVSAAAWAHGPGGNAGSSACGPGMMGPGMGMGMMGPGTGMGMMGPGTGMGMMGPGTGMMGPGMGTMGPGMGMGTMGPGAMMDGWDGEPGNCAGAGRGPGVASGLELTEEQRAKIVDIQRETHADARSRIESVLTDEQKQKLRSAAGPRW